MQGFVVIHDIIMNKDSTNVEKADIKTFMIT